MESLDLLMRGFSVALQPTNIMFAVIGCLVGTLIGVLPGIGPVTGTAMLIPVTLVLEPTSAIIMLAAIFYGTMYGGTITSVLVNVPGEVTSAITCIEGNAMAKKGQAGKALAIAAVGSFFGGTVSTLGLVLLAMPLTSLALMFGPPEFFCLMFVGLTLVTGLAGRSLARALLSALLGLMAALVGIDPVLGSPRFVFGQINLLDGFGLVPVAMGLFGLGEILINIERPIGRIVETRLRDLFLTWDDVRRSTWPIIRGTLMGFSFGMIPGMGGIVPTFMSYVIERKLSKYPEKFGTGVIEGVASPETTNNAYAGGSMIPLFTLGIPGTPTSAVLMGALMMNGLIPGPLLFQEHADFVWAVIASFYVGNAILVILNLPLIPLWVSVLKIPHSILYSLIVGFMAIGSYTVDRSIFDVGMMLCWGIVGYLFKKLDIPPAPLILTLILAPLMERGLRQSLTMSQGDFAIFFERPLSAFLLAVGALFILAAVARVGTQIRAEGQDAEV